MCDRVFQKSLVRRAEKEAFVSSQGTPESGRDDSGQAAVKNRGRMRTSKPVKSFGPAPCRVIFIQALWGREDKKVGPAGC